MLRASMIVTRSSAPLPSSYPPSFPPVLSLLSSILLLRSFPVPGSRLVPSSFVPLSPVCSHSPSPQRVGSLRVGSTCLHQLVYLSCICACAYCLRLCIRIRVCSVHPSRLRLRVFTVACLVTHSQTRWAL
ncbi:hypothetical protein BDN71DRAFT_662306 [Pleurotus eryngii]|uniref:Uncharacterized protein n=1 Tax=Pleurotus eryngii TaxID=5323 RepID=A0A9P6D8K0_PLEER|nr:hypothetical protein BDN71DRAFT_662306 [Pleurotus eryngii]